MSSNERIGFRSSPHYPAFKIFGGTFLAVAVFIVATAMALTGRDQEPIPEGMPPAAGAVVPQIDLDAPGRTAVQLQGWAEERSRDGNVPAISMQAYGYAALLLARSKPECEIRWTTLAGIAYIESKHGTYAGSRIGPDGRISPPIRGVPLDGSPGIAVIVDSDQGKMDGDTVHDRAMGPFQFIPETWKRFGTDANGDGYADPDNIDDAALTAAKYLCASGGKLGTAQGWRKALMTYNQSEQYLLDVRDAAAAYALGRPAG